MSRMTRDPEAYWLDCGRQMGREQAAVDAALGRPKRDPRLLVPFGCHPAYGEGLIEGYEDAWTATDPLAVAMGGN